MPRPKSDLTAERWTVNTAECAHVLGLAPTSLAKLVASGMPKVANGRFYLPIVVEWMLDRAKRRAEATEERAEAITARMELTEAQTLKTQLEAAEKMGLLVEREIAEQAIIGLVQACVDCVESIPSRVDTDPFTRERITEAARAARTDLDLAIVDASGELPARPDDSAAPTT